MPANNYSTETHYNEQSGPRSKQVPFRVYAEIYPDPEVSGNRWETVREWNAWAEDVQEDLVDAGINIALPVAFTPQFAAAPARVTLHGFYDIGQTDNIGKPTTSDVNVDSPGGIKTGNKGGSLSRGQVPTAFTQSEVADLKSTIEGLITAAVTIFKIDYNGTIYGRGGFSFPS
jgi:hypothetical protein